VWSICIVVLPPLFEQDRGLAQGVEDFAMEQLVSEPGLEALAESVLPGGSRLDVGRLGTDGSDPVPDRLRYEIRAVV